MLEIIAIISLCKKTKENAIARGKQPTVAVIYTILLWLGMEIWGAVVTASVLGFFGVYNELQGLIYVAGLGCAALGGYIAILISKVAAPINGTSEIYTPAENTINNENKDIL